MSHVLYVGSAFGVSALAIAVLIGWVVLDFRRQRRQLAELERLGMTRRSYRADRDQA